MAKLPKANPRSIRARYDAAQTTTNNARLWTGADGFSAARAGNPEARRILRERSRYECQENNSYAKGICLSITDFHVGRGPRIRVDTGDETRDRLIETRFMQWWKAIRGAEKLRTMKTAKTVDGESFALKVTNPGTRNPVTLDYRIYEADQIATPYWTSPIDEEREVDGIKFDEYGNPAEYSILKSHPGAETNIFDFESDWVPADEMIHIFRADRPGQRRGIPETAAALPLFPMMRQFAMATLEAATSAAYWMAVMHSDAPPDAGPAQIEDEPFSVFDLERNAVMNLPDGWKVSQLKPEHPTTMYSDFKDHLLAEAARCLNVPFNIASGNSADYNFASGRLDWQAFFRAVDIERNYLEQVVLDRIFDDWLDEALLLPGYLPPLEAMEELPRMWLWDGQPILDPVKDANASVALFNVGLLDEDAYWGERGRDTDQVLKRMAERMRMRSEAGLPVPGQSPQANSQTDDKDETDDEEDGNKSKTASRASNR